MAKTTPQHNNSPAPSLRRSVDDYRVDNTEVLDRTVTVRAWPAQPDRAVERRQRCVWKVRTDILGDR
jgi:hypothetical protein